MSDVLQAAHKYHNQLNAEIAKIDDFLRFAEKMAGKSVPVARTPLTDAAPKALSSDLRIEEPVRASAVGGEAKQEIAEVAPEKVERKSLFRGAFERIESEPLRDVA